MGDADTQTTTNNSSTSPTPPKHQTPVSVEEEEDSSKKQKLNGTDQPEEEPTNNNESLPPDHPPDDDGEESKPAEEPTFQVQVMYNKKPIPLQISPSMTVLQLKKMIEDHTGVDPNLQKVLLKGIAKDESLLKDLGVSEGSTKKILVIGSSIQDVLKVKEVPTTTAGDDEGGGGGGGSKNGNNWCSLPTHKKVIDKGLPDDAMPGILDEHDPLPPFPLHGMYSSKGSKVRLTFKLENDELWIGTKERTEKVPISTIRNVTSQPITGYEHYHIVAIQLGPTEASRFFVYWVPAQYVEAIKDALTGA